jgi:hypothetical protein
MDGRDTGLLLNPNNIKLHRNYFIEMTRLLGINVIYRAPREDKHYNGYGELDSFYYEPVVTSCIFDEHPTQWTMKKLGWNSELSDSLSVIHIPYDLPNIQVGALFIIPSAVDNAEGRLFRVIRMSTISVYPAYIACEIGPVWENTNQVTDINYKDQNFTMLVDNEDGEE